MIASIKAFWNKHWKLILTGIGSSLATSLVVAVGFYPSVLAKKQLEAEEKKQVVLAVSDADANRYSPVAEGAFEFLRHPDAPPVYQADTYLSFSVRNNGRPKVEGVSAFVDGRSGIYELAKANGGTEVKTFTGSVPLGDLGQQEVTRVRLWLAKEPNAAYPPSVHLRWADDTLAVEFPLKKLISEAKREREERDSSWRQFSFAMGLLGIVSFAVPLFVALRRRARKEQLAFEELQRKLDSLNANAEKHSKVSTFLVGEYLGGLSEKDKAELVERLNNLFGP